MTAKAAVPEKRSARERLLAAAQELFYEEGVNTVGIDRVIERAGVAKASLYDCFGSKDELIRAYLESRQISRQARIMAGVESCSTPRDKLLAIFEVSGDLFKDTKYRGCAFLRASAEVKAGSSIKTVCDESRAWLRNLFAHLAEEAGAREPRKLADQFMMLYDGASVAAQMDRKGLAAAASARMMAAMLLDAAT